MALHKYYEFFKLFNKKGNEDYKSALDYFIKNYQSLEFNPTVDIKSNHAYVAFFYNKSLHSYMIDFKNGRYQVTDCQKDVELSPEEKKRTRMETYYLEVEISKDEFEYYLNEFQKISDYLDDKSEHDKSSVGSNGLNMNLSDREILEMQLDEAVNKTFKEYLNKEYEFEVLYYVWSSNSSNEKKIDRLNLKLTSLKARPYLNWDEDDNTKPKFYVEIELMYDGKEYYIHFDEKTETQYIDLSKNRKMNMILTRDTRHLTRKQKREEDNRPFPRTDYRDISASKYDTIDLLSNIKQFLEAINDNYNS